MVSQIDFAHSLYPRFPKISIRNIPDSLSFSNLDILDRFRRGVGLMLPFALKHPLLLFSLYAGFLLFLEGERKKGLEINVL